MVGQTIYDRVFFRDGAIGFGGIAYAIGFVNNVLVPKSIDVGVTSALGTALLVNVGLILLFGLQHSVTAGFSHKHGPAEFSLAYQYALPAKESVGASQLIGGDFDNSEIEAQAHWLFLSFGFRF